jgi:hypothetical protein
MRSAYCCRRMGTYFSSMPRSISTASTETLGTSTLSASGVPLRSRMVPRLGVMCRRRWRCFSASSRQASPSTTSMSYAPETMVPSPMAIKPQSNAMRTRIQRARRGSRFLMARQPPWAAG